MIEPGTKDWTWVLERACPDCGFDATAIEVAQVPAVLRANAVAWEQVLALPDVAERPDPKTWSVLEYAGHVREVHRVFEARLTQLLDEADPRFAGWDQDEAAITGRYADQDPATVAAGLSAAATSVAEAYARVPADAWARRGFRDDGTGFTVASLARYHAHDVVHHEWDVRAAASRATVAAYDRSVTAYRDGTAAVPGQVRSAIGDFIARVPPGARVLEIGSGPGRDALVLEEAGLSVRRTDVAAGFVQLMRAAGHAADVLDPLVDDLDDPDRPGVAYDAVWANASLLHVHRADLPAVLARLAGATAPRGVLRVSVKEGDGEAWSEHGHVTGARRFTFWREAPLRAVAEQAGWQVEEVVHYDGDQTGQPWLDLRARRA